MSKKKQLKDDFYSTIDTLPNLPEAALVRYPRFVYLLDQIKICVQMTRLWGEPNCMSLEGQPAAGKTTLVKDFCSHFPWKETKNGTIMDVLYVLPDSPTTIRELVSEMLLAMGVPGADEGQTWSLKKRLIRHIKKCRLKIIIIDDIQGLLVTDTPKQIKKLSEWLKTLIKKTGVCFVILGVDGSIEEVLKSNSQLARLFASRKTLDPFAFDSNDESTVVEFGKMVVMAETTLETKIEPSPDMDRIDLLKRIHYATDGLMGHIMNLLRLGRLKAEMNGRQTINLRDLSEAFVDRLQALFPRKINPFDFEKNTGTLRAIPSKPQEPPPSNDPPDSTGNRSKPKKKEPSISQVLSTK
jgi:hypothetical protein